jgi:NAD(P)-dependent dehydrogenase (short-subunit alcohol dehydrogenase family)
MELGGDQIRVNALCPGSVEGARIDRVMANDAKERGVDQAEIRRIYESQSSLKRFVEAKDIASMVLFLVSDSGRYISGQAIGIDGHTESLASLS